MISTQFFEMVRRDRSSLLFHFTKAPPKPIDVQTRNGNRKVRSARDVLDTILHEGALRGSCNTIKSGENVVCFTEAPISEVAACFAASVATGNEYGYDPYGIAVQKQWLFEQGGRPVIYQPDADYEHLGERVRYLHKEYDPGAGIDFMWEREWRIKTDKLRLVTHHLHLLVIVRDIDDAEQFRHDHMQVSEDEDGFIEAYPGYSIVSLDLFGV